MSMTTRAGEQKGRGQKGRHGQEPVVGGLGGHVHEGEDGHHGVEPVVHRVEERDPSTHHRPQRRGGVVLDRAGDHRQVPHYAQNHGHGTHRCDEGGWHVSHQDVTGYHKGDRDDKHESGAVEQDHRQGLIPGGERVWELHWDGTHVGTVLDPDRHIVNLTSDQPTKLPTSGAEAVPDAAGEITYCAHRRRMALVVN